MHVIVFFLNLLALKIRDRWKITAPKRLKTIKYTLLILSIIVDLAILVGIIAA